MYELLHEWMNIGIKMNEWMYGSMNEWRKTGKKNPIMLFYQMIQAELDLTHVGL